MRRHDLPDLDLVVAAVDEPRIKLRVGASLWNQAVAKYPGGADGALPPPLFSSTINRGHVDLPWADFSFYMPRKSHKLRTPPWSELHPKMIRESAGVQWQDKIELAVHTGNVGSPYRKKLARAAEQNSDTMLVNELFIGDHGKIKQTCHELGRERIGGYQKHKCYMTFTEQCSYKYLINSASIGYANKFKYLLLCGSVVLYVQVTLHPTPTPTPTLTLTLILTPTLTPTLTLTLTLTRTACSTRSSTSTASSQACITSPSPPPPTCPRR